MKMGQPRGGEECETSVIPVTRPVRTTGLAYLLLIPWDGQSPVLHLRNKRHLGIISSSSSGLFLWGWVRMGEFLFINRLVECSWLLNICDKSRSVLLLVSVRCACFRVITFTNIAIVQRGG